MNKKTTKRALFMSALSLVLCISMLIGSTFAWFTDSVTSANNIIKSGNLDIELDYWDGDEWKSIENADDILSGDRWEPGYVGIAYLRLSNVGTLAAKYQFAVNVNSEKAGVNAAGESFLLSDYIYFDVLEGDATADGAPVAYADRAEAIKDVEGKKISEGFVDRGFFSEAGDMYFNVIAYMPEEVGNVANHNGETLPEINLGINVFATQKDVESDSFGKDYDENAASFTVAEANAMIAKNKDVILVGANEPTETIEVPANYTGTITLDNVTIAGIKQTDAVTFAARSEANTVNLVVYGNLVVKAIADNTSAITAEKLNITGNGNITAIANGNHAYGIGGDNTKEITIKGVTIVDVKGGHVQPLFVNDTKYGKSEPEGGAAIGSGYNGAVITLENVTVKNAEGGSKAAAIGGRFWTGTTINVVNSTIENVYGGNASAAIGGSRVSSDANEAETIINITSSVVMNAVGGQFGAGIGSGYDTHCASNQPLCTINITDSTVTAKGGKYAAGVGTGFHNGALAGDVVNSTINATSGEKVYKDSYTAAMDIGFGVIDLAREGQQTDSYLNYNGTKITMASAPDVVTTTDDLKVALSSDAEDIVVVLGSDVSVDIGTGWKMGGANTKSITIDGNGKKLTLSSTYRSYFNIANADGVLNLNNMTLTNTHKGTHFFDYTTHFNCDVVATNVVFEKSPLVSGGATAVFTNCEFNQAGNDIYGLWIMTGTNVTVNGGVLNTDRGFKIADEDSAKELTTLSVSGTKFNNTKKAAILVTTKYGANITLDNVDISNCGADSTNEVWLDDGRTDYADTVVVTGGNIVIEP